jgi:uncharacterized protein
MIVDCYTCIWDSPQQLGRGSVRRPAHGSPNRPLPGDDPPPRAGTEKHLAASEPVDTTIVVGFKSAYLGADIPNELVHDYVKQHPGRLIGFCGIDPTDPTTAVAEMRTARDDLDMRGVAISPAAQNFHPAHTNAKTCYDAAADLQMPVLFHSGVRNSPECVMQYSQPVLLDEVAREFPTLRLIIAHMGYPWPHETIALLAKHANVFSDISWLLHQPWQAYQCLIAAHQHGVMDKLLFGSGFPYTNAALCIEALYGINHVAQGTNLPPIPREQLRGIVERDALTLLGIGRNDATRNGREEHHLLDDEE